jgi:2-C-methyl-D-erythritol 4-phosphate cytidylyltransferase/2-C-methyl-D-erythritol 2,4-cyclodiphosphate synthase
MAGVTAPTRPRTAAIVAAGGAGLRLGGAPPKQFLDLGGRSMLDASVAALADSGLVDELVIAAPAAFVAEVAARTRGARVPTIVVAGGARRQDSVANAVSAVSPSCEIVLVHDAARPFVAPAVIARVIGAAASHGAAIPAISVRDTVKQVGAAGADGARPIRATLARDEIVLAQTPQGFRRAVLAHAIDVSDADATDEAMLVERAGHPVVVVEGDAGNVKITTAEDLEQARRRMSKEHDSIVPVLRVGTGYDLHLLTAGRPLVLGGVTIPFEKGLEGHSDADIVCHAITDAVLGASGLGDIGRQFPDTDRSWKDADSTELLRLAIVRVHDAGFRVVNVDATVVAQRPTLSPHVDRMRERLAGVLRVSPVCVSVKGKTNEGQDAIGRGDAMACHAVALLAGQPSS